MKFIDSIKDKAEFCRDVYEEFPKLTLTGLGLTVILTLSSVWWVSQRSSQWFDCTWVKKYELEKTMVFKHLTGKCFVNLGTDDNINLIPVSRLIGALDGSIGED